MEYIQRHIKSPSSSLQCNSIVIFLKPSLSERSSNIWLKIGRNVLSNTSNNMIIGSIKKDSEGQRL